MIGRVAIVLLAVACSGRERARPAPRDDAPRAAAETAIDAAAIPRADTSWMTSHDFDGDGKRDVVSVDYSGGAHCCYKLAVTLSTTRRTVAIPFELDGGYVSGLTLERPENFTIEIRDGVATFILAIAGYNGRPAPIPREWTTAYGVHSHRIRVGVRSGKLQVENLGWTCDEATSAFVHREFDAWEGWPATCSYAALLSDLAINSLRGDDEMLGDGRVATSFERVTAKLSIGDRSSVELALSYRGDRIARIDLDEPGLGAPGDLVAALGPPEARLRYTVWGFVQPSGQWVWASRGLAIYVDAGGAGVRRVAVFTPTDVATYRRELAWPAPQP